MTENNYNTYYKTIILVCIIVSWPQMCSEWTLLFRRNSMFYHIGINGSQTSSKNFSISRYLLALQCSLCNLLHIS